MTHCNFLRVVLTDECSQLPGHMPKSDGEYKYVYNKVISALTFKSSVMTVTYAFLILMSEVDGYISTQYITICYWYTSFPERTYEECRLAWISRLGSFSI